MKNASWLEHPALKNINPIKLTILTELITEAEGIPLDKSLPLLLKTNAKLKAQNLAFTQEESALIMDLLTKDMSTADKLKFDNMKQMMGKMGKKK